MSTARRTPLLANRSEPIVKWAVNRLGRLRLIMAGASTLSGPTIRQSSVEGERAMIRDQPRIVLAGGAGFLGRLLIPWLQNRDWDVVVLTRRPGAVKHSAREAAWDGGRLGDWRRALEGAQAVVNLAGRSVNCRYHARYRHDILRSRVDSTARWARRSPVARRRRRSG